MPRKMMIDIFFKSMGPNLELHQGYKLDRDNLFLLFKEHELELNKFNVNKNKRINKLNKQVRFPEIKSFDILA